MTTEFEEWKESVTSKDTRELNPPKSETPCNNCGALPQNSDFRATFGAIANSASKVLTCGGETL